MESVSGSNAMKLSLQIDQEQSAESDHSDGVDNQSIVVPAKLIATADGFVKKEKSWFAMSQIPTDLSIQVEEITFYVHQYPLVSRCGYFARIEIQPTDPNSYPTVTLENFPGGSKSFETTLKFCYGLPINLNPNNIATLRCASEFLEMNEALEDGNLISKTEAFFTFVVLSSWRDSITVLKSCEDLSPWAENLQIVRRCCDSIAWKISREKGELTNERNWWFDEMVTLKINHFTRIITALRAKGVDLQTIGSCIEQYGEKWLPCMEFERGGFDRFGFGRNELQWNVTSGRRQELDIGQMREQRMIVESLVSIVPPGKETVSCKFLLKMLRLAILNSASPALVSELEKRVGLVLENADVNDLIIPNYTAADQWNIESTTEGHTMHNTDVVQRILEYFLLYEQQHQQQQQQIPGPMAISKLLDSYLVQIARDSKLPVTKFQVLAQCLPENARTSDDGLYRAIDTYLKTHPTLSDHDQKRLCKVMDCGKLSLDACEHAAQNDRLPLRTIVQVLFSEQVKIRAMVVQGQNQTEAGDKNLEPEGNWSSTNKEVKDLKQELEKVKSQMAELKADYSELQRDYNNINSKKQRKLSGWAVGWRKIRQSALFHVKMDGEDTDESQMRQNASQGGSFRRRQSIS